MKIRVMNKPLVRVYNSRAIHANRNRTFEPDSLEELFDTIPDDTKFPVTFSMIHNEVEMRALIVFGPKNSGLLDMSFGDYERLPEMEIEYKEIKEEE